MKKNRNLIKIFLTLVQIFVLGLPLFAFCFNAVAYRLGLKDLATSVSGNTESSIDESTFLNETNDINKFALQSIYDFNYVNKGQEITSYEYQNAYPTSDELVVGNYYTFTISGLNYDLHDDQSLIDTQYTTIESSLFFTDVISIQNNDFYFEGSDFNGEYIDTEIKGVYFYNYYDIFCYLDGDDNLENFEFDTSVITLTFFDFWDLYGSFSFSIENDTYITFSEFDVTCKYTSSLASSIGAYFYTYTPYYSSMYTRQSTTSELIDIPSFISATEGMSYEEIVSNNYVNTHLLLNLDIVGLFTNNLSGNAYVYLWLNYFMNYLLTMSIVFICFDVIMYFILIVRKILDRSVEYTDRREF